RQKMSQMRPARDGGQRGNQGGGAPSSGRQWRGFGGGAAGAPGDREGGRSEGGRSGGFAGGRSHWRGGSGTTGGSWTMGAGQGGGRASGDVHPRSEEHTSELQSRQ